MEVRFFVDRDTGLPHVEQHGVDPQEAAEAFRNREYDVPSRNGTRMAEGRTMHGRALRVIYTLNEMDHSILVITAYDLRGKALQAFRRRQRKRR